MYKPQAIKPMTINAADMSLKVKQAYKGMVGFFHNEPNDQGETGARPITPGRRPDVRSKKRDHEAPREAARLREEAARSRPVREKERVVSGYDAKEGRRPLAGGHDLFSLHRSDGPELTQRETGELVRECVARFAPGKRPSIVKPDVQL